MKTNHLPTRLIGLALLACLSICLQHQPRDFRPAPTEIVPHSDASRDQRSAWIDQLHRRAPGTDWQLVEYQNQIGRQARRRSQGGSRADCSLAAAVAGAPISGRWLERGSDNQAGSIFETAYDPKLDEIWLISAGGSLWKSPRLEPSWQVVNQELQFDRGFLAFLKAPGTTDRLLAFSGRQPHYSDDRGRTWQRASGMAPTGPAPDFRSPLLLPDNRCFVLGKSSYYEHFRLYSSVDRGESYQQLLSFDSSDPTDFTLCNPTHSSRLLLARKTADDQLRLQEWHATQQVLVEVPMSKPLFMGKAPANLIGAVNAEGLLQLFLYREQEGRYWLLRSLDSGRTWKEVGELPQTPWEVGLFLSPSDPNVLFLGEVEAFRSTDGGKSWRKINEWWEYYDRIETALHADMMKFAEYQSPAGETFTLISHHGGLSISYDQFDSQQNMALQGLNTSQYYSVRTDPLDPAFVYAGSQDQGLQRSVSFGDESMGAESFEQVISGDYGPIALTRGGTAMWTVYPGGWINYYDNPQSGYVRASFEVVSEDEPIWFPPILAHPNRDKNGILLAGGNLNGGPGSYLITLEYQNKKIQSRQFDYNFLLESAGGALSALGSAPSAPQHWYAATSNGRFFFSEDQGEHWEQSLNFIPEGHYLYGQAIWVSRTDHRRVILAGSGYDNPPVFLSRDGGRSFRSIHRGLPPTMVFALAADQDERLLFAATEAGPFVYVFADDRWYDLSSECSPAQSFWAVEYIDALQTVRFGTYGRGIWDFLLDRTTPVVDRSTEPADLRVYPNPSRGDIYLATDAPQPLQLRIVAANGQLVRSFRNVPPGTPIDLHDLADGVYWLHFLRGEEQIVRRLVISK